jgi:hypothetical protein
VQLLKNASSGVLGRSINSTYEKKVRLVDFTPCGLAGSDFETPQEMGITIRSSASF